MSTLLRFASLTFLGLCAAVPAQEGTDKAKPADSKKAQNPAPKDDAATAADKAIKAIDEFTSKAQVDKKSSSWKTSLKQPPKLEFDAKSDYLWHIETELGPITVRYYPDAAPLHVSSGIYLSRLGFYDGLTFHRIIPGFMAQGGCPLGSGSGSPGYKFAGEFYGNVPHSKAGILSMANAGPGTDGSQFFLTFAKQSGLNGGYTVWGEVVEGMDTLKALESKGTHANNGQLPKDKQVKIVRTSIQVVPKAEKPNDKPAEEKPKDGGK